MENLAQMMAELLTQLQSQTSIFWIAAFSVALGATLLMVSGVIMARRKLPGSMTLRGRRRTPGTSGPAAPSTISLTDTGYALTPPVSASGARAAEMSAIQMADLLKRLKTAANSLEDLQTTLRIQEKSTRHSGLKEPVQDVEYVFKAGIS
jgi:hypothetical protein|nr:hypothetical protein [Candidatus Krumholzibacteria bacterium]